METIAFDPGTKRTSRVDVIASIPTSWNSSTLVIAQFRPAGVVRRQVNTIWRLGLAIYTHQKYT